MTSAMEWEAPIPAWIESIDIDEIPVSDLMVLIPGDMDDTRRSGTPKGHNRFLTCATELHSPFGTFVDDMKMLKTNSSVETQCSTAPNLSPIKSKPTTTSNRRSRRKATTVDPTGRNQRRKDKQRGYETNYRKRQKEKRDRDQVEWVQLETQLREMLLKRTTFIVVGSMEPTARKPSTSWMRQRYLELLQEERALRESKALDNCVWAETQAMTFWGGANGKTRDIREQMNTLPSLRNCHTFTFSW